MADPRGAPMPSTPFRRMGVQGVTPLLWPGMEACSRGAPMPSTPFRRMGVQGVTPSLAGYGSLLAGRPHALHALPADGGPGGHPLVSPWCGPLRWL